MAAFSVLANTGRETLLPRSSELICSGDGLKTSVMQSPCSLVCRGGAQESRRAVLKGSRKMPAYCHPWEEVALVSCFPDNNMDIALEAIGLVWGEGACVCFEADMLHLGSSFCTRISCQVRLSSSSCTLVYAEEGASDDVVRFTVDEMSVEEHCSLVPVSVSGPDLATWQDGHHCLCGIRRGTDTFSAETRDPYYNVAACWKVCTCWTPTDDTNADCTARANNTLQWGNCSTLPDATRLRYQF